MALPLKDGWDVNADQLRGAVASLGITGSDQTPARASRGVYIGGAGNLVCRLVGDTADSTFVGLTAGSYYPLEIAFIEGTGTTITNSLLLF